MGITQSAILGTNVTCGGIYATAFSCGSTRQAPLTPAVSISLDTITYFSDDGLIVEGKLLENQFVISKRDAMPKDSLVEDMLLKFDEMQSEIDGLKTRFSEQEEHIGVVADAVHTGNKGVLVEVFISIGVVFVCGLIVLALRKR